MFIHLLILVCSYSLVGSLSVDPNSNGKYIDGTQYTIKSVGTIYTQHVSDDGQCSVKLNDQTKSLTEGDTIKIKTKWFKVEECRLNRAYPAACGSKLFYHLRDLACSFIEQKNDNKMHVQQQTKDKLNQFMNKAYYNVCCESACTVSEFLQYCPTRW